MKVYRKATMDGALFSEGLFQNITRVKNGCQPSKVGNRFFAVLPKILFGTTFSFSQFFPKDFFI